MKKFKLFVWAVILIIFQTVFAHYIRIFDTSPLFILPTVIVIMFMEDEFSNAMIIAAIGSVCAGVFTGRNFFISIIIVMLFSIIIFSCRARLRYMPEIWKVVLWTGIVTFIWETLSYLCLYHTLSGYISMLVPHVLVSIIYNIVISCIIYPLIKKTIYGYKEKRRNIKQYVK